MQTLGAMISGNGDQRLTTIYILLLASFCFVTLKTFVYKICCTYLKSQILSYADTLLKTRACDSGWPSRLVI